MRVARYVRHGHGISHRAFIAKQNNIHPVSHWMKEMQIDKETALKLLVYAGDHQTGLYGRRTRFFRLPDLLIEEEAKKFYNVYWNSDPAKKKFLKYLKNYLDESKSQKPAFKRRQNLVQAPGRFSHSGR